MINFAVSFSDIERDFKSHHIPVDQPGFYDHPNFIKVENLNPLYLNNYARFVNERPREPAYDEYVRQTVPIVVRVLHEHLKANGRLGACVDMSAILSRALEKEGVWNFIVKGSLTIEFSKETKISPKFFWSVDTGEFIAGHAWVAAPPYFIVDVSVRRQQYLDGEEEHLPDAICSSADELTVGTLEDVVSPEIRARLSSMGVPKAQQLQKMVGPSTPMFMKAFPARLHSAGKTVMKYIPIGAIVPAEPFQDMRAILFEGKTGFELYANNIKTALTLARNVNLLTL